MVMVAGGVDAVAVGALMRMVKFENNDRFLHSFTIKKCEGLAVDRGL
jgi:hypothetical protein